MGLFFRVSQGPLLQARGVLNSMLPALWEQPRECHSSGTVHRARGIQMCP